MATRRTQRVSRVIKEVVSRCLLYELTDPRMGFVTVTEVDVAPDMKRATVRVSVLGEAKGAELCLRAIEHARGRIQSEVAAELTMKVMPHLEFELDERVKKSIEISRLINLARSEYRLTDEEAAEAAGDRGPNEETDEQ